MQYKSQLLAAGLLAGFAAAAPAPEPQSPEQVTSAIDQFSSYFDSLTTNTALLSLETYATVPSISSAVDAWGSSFLAGIQTGATAAPNFDSLPTEVRGPISSIGMSIYGVATSILSADDFTLSALPTSLLGGIEGGDDDDDSSSFAAVQTSAASSKSGAASVSASVSASASASGSAASKSASGSAGAAASTTASQAGAAPSGALKAAAGIAAGFVGVVMAL